MSAMLVCSTNNLIRLYSHGKPSEQPLAWWLRQLADGQQFELPCGEVFTAWRDQTQALITIATNCYTRTNDAITITVAPDTQLVTWEGTTMSAADIKEGVRLVGRHGMAVVRQRSHIIAPAVVCNAREVYGLKIAQKGEAYGDMDNQYRDLLATHAGRRESRALAAAG